MKRSIVVWTIFALVAPITALHAAEWKLATLFSDHMVLQRDKSVPVWGWAEPGEQVRVTFADQEKTATADADGKWTVALDPLPASDKPRTLTAEATEAQHRTEVNDVLVGEVWLGSGQSNMAMTVDRARDFPSEKASADLPRIRMFKETSAGADSPREDAQGSWTVCSPDTVGGFSATLYFFGRELHRELDVPVGLINSSVGGTPIESWIAAEAQAESAELKETHTAAARAYAAFDEEQAESRYQQALERWKEQAARAKADGKPVPRRPNNPVERRRHRGGPGGLFHGKIAPLVPYAIRGAVWYQGEGNANSAQAGLYRYQLPLLVSDWRARGGEPFPFAWVQLPNFQRDGEGWMVVQEAMLETLSVPDTGMAITIDIGDPRDIHPQNKQDVGLRLAMWALGDVYGQSDTATSGPLPIDHKVRDQSIVVSFSHCDGGLEARGGELTGFAIAGKDRQWKPATARIDGDQVVVTHPEVSQPVAVRYAWATDPDCNLYNGAGLPASPFRTDRWPVDSDAAAN